MSVYDRGTKKVRYLAIEIEQVECEQVDANRDVLRPHVFAFPPTEVLEWEEFLRRQIKSDRLGIDDERVHARLETLKSNMNPKRDQMRVKYSRHLLQQVWILRAHVLGIPTEYGDGPVGKQMHLGPLAIVLVLAGKVLALEAVKDFGNRLCWLGQHRFQGYTWRRCFSLANKMHALLDIPGVSLQMSRKFSVPPFIKAGMTRS